MMILPKIKEVTSILNFAKKFFTKGSFRHVQNYVAGLISVGKKSIKKISEASKTNQQSLNYAINEAKFEKEKLEERYLKKMKFLFKNAKVFLILDDTLVERNGKKIESTQKHFDHNSNNYVNGHQFFTAIFCIGFLQIPIFPELYSKETDSKIEMAKNLVDKMINSKIKIDTYLFDSWYSDKDLIKKCREKSRVICAVKSNRNIFIGRSNKERKVSFIRERLISQKLRKCFVEDKTYFVFEKEARLNKVPEVKFLISEIENQKINLISTNKKDSAEEIIMAYKIRWKIETYHRDIKQNLGFAKAFLRRRNGIVCHAIFVAIAHAVLNLFMFRQGIQMTVGECCKYLREKSENNLVKKIVEVEDKSERMKRFEEAFI